MTHQHRPPLVNQLSTDVGVSVHRGGRPRSKNLVYFLRPVGQRGPIKIGCSHQPQRRLDHFLDLSPVPLEIVATTSGGSQLERRLHGVFAASHSHREWFRETPELTLLVERLAAGEQIDDLIDLTAPILPFPGRHRGKRGKPIAPRLATYLRVVTP